MINRDTKMKFIKHIMFSDVCIKVQEVRDCGEYKEIIGTWYNLGVKKPFCIGLKAKVAISDYTKKSWFEFYTKDLKKTGLRGMFTAQLDL